MFEIPNEIQKKLHGFAHKRKKSTEEVTKLFYKEFNHTAHIDGTFDDRCGAALDNVEKILFSTKNIEGRYEKDVEIVFKVLNKHGIQQFRKFADNKEIIDIVTSVSGVIVLDETDAGTVEILPSYGILTLYGDACRIAEDLREGHSYRMILDVRIDDRYLELKKSQYIEPEEVKVSLPSPAAIALEHYDIIQLHDADKNIGKNRWLRAKIHSYETRVAKSTNKIYGIINIVDCKDKKHKYPIKTLWFSDPDIVMKYDLGSECLFLCNVEDGMYQGVPQLSIFGKEIIPIEIALIPQPVKLEEEEKEWI